MCKKGLEEESEEERNSPIVDNKIKMISSNWEVMDPELKKWSLFLIKNCLFFCPLFFFCGPVNFFLFDFWKKGNTKSFKKIALVCLPQVHFFLAENKKEKKKEKKKQKKNKNKKKQKKNKNKKWQDRHYCQIENTREKREGEERRGKTSFFQGKHCTKYGTTHFLCLNRVDFFWFFFDFFSIFLRFLKVHDKEKQIR